MKTFLPDYNNLLQAAKNVKPDRIPLYDHKVNDPFISKYFGVNLEALLETGKKEDLRIYFSHVVRFFVEMGYDTVSFEYCIGPTMPGSGSLGGHKPGVIQNRSDFDGYPWEKLEDLYFDSAGIYFEMLREVLPEGMKAVGGVGNGIFECVQDVVGYERLCLISFDDPELYKLLFETVGRINAGIWNRFLDNYADIYVVCRFGDDLGYKSSTLLSKQDVLNFILPQYKKVIEIIHSYDKPFLFHSCGCIFEIMDELINAGIDAKHSNEDAIAPFTTWTMQYGNRIGNFGGIDMDILCQKNEDEIRSYTLNILEQTADCGGVAYGSGNSIPYYIPINGYMAMNKTIREFRGDQI